MSWKLSNQGFSGSRSVGVMQSMVKVLPRPIQLVGITPFEGLIVDPYDQRLGWLTATSGKLW